MLFSALLFPLLIPKIYLNSLNLWDGKVFAIPGMECWYSIPVPWDGKVFAVPGMESCHILHNLTKMELNSAVLMCRPFSKWMNLDKLTLSDWKLTKISLQISKLIVIRLSINNHVIISKNGAFVQIPQWIALVVSFVKRIKGCHIKNIV